MLRFVALRSTSLPMPDGNRAAFAVRQMRDFLKFHAWAVRTTILNAPFTA